MPQILAITNAPSMLVGASPYWCSNARKLVYVDISVKAVHSFDPISFEYVSMDFTQTEYAEEHVTFVIEDKFLSAQDSQNLVILVGLHQRILRVAMMDPPVIVTVYEIHTAPSIALTPEHRLNCADFCPEHDELIVGYMHTDWRHDKMGNLVRLSISQGHNILNACDAMQKRSGAPHTVHLPNGLAWCSSRSFYMVDAAQAEILKITFRADSRMGKCMTEESPRLIYSLKEEYVQKSYFLAGLAIDREGAIWSALSGAGCILQIDPITGREMFKLRLDFDFPTAVCFGGQLLDHLYITARTGKGSTTKKMPLVVAKINGVKGLRDEFATEGETIWNSMFCGLFF